MTRTNVKHRIRIRPAAILLAGLVFALTNEWAVAGLFSGDMVAERLPILTAE